MAKSKFFSFLIIIVAIAVVAFFILGKINPGMNILNEIFTGSITGIVIVIVGVVVIIAFIKMIRGNVGR
jgi:hypothetical protein